MREYRCRTGHWGGVTMFSGLLEQSLCGLGSQGRADTVAQHPKVSPQLSDPWAWPFFTAVPVWLPGLPLGLLPSSLRPAFIFIFEQPWKSQDSTL